MKLLGERSNAPVDADAFLVGDRRPAGYLLEGAQTAAAHVIAQHRGAVADAGGVGGDFAGMKSEWCGHGAIIPVAGYPAPDAISTILLLRV